MTSAISRNPVDTQASVNRDVTGNQSTVGGQTDRSTVHSDSSQAQGTQQQTQTQDSLENIPVRQMPVGELRSNIQTSMREVQARLGDEVANNPNYEHIQTWMDNYLAHYPHENVDINRMMMDLANDIGRQRPPFGNFNPQEMSAALSNLASEILKVDVTQVVARDDQITMLEYQVLRNAIEDAHPEYRFPMTPAGEQEFEAYMNQRLDNVNNPARQAFVQEYREKHINDRNPPTDEDIQKAWSNSSERRHLFNEAKMGRDGFQKMIELCDAHFRENPSDPIKADEFKKMLREDSGVMFGQLKTEHDIAFSLFASGLSSKAATSIREELKKEQGVRFSFENPMTWVAIALAVLSVVLAITGAGSALAMILALSATGIFVWEMGIDIASGHMFMDRTAYNNLLDKPAVDSRELYSGAQDTLRQFEVNTKEAVAAEELLTDVREPINYEQQIEQMEEDLEQLRMLPADDPQTAEIYERYGIDPETPVRRSGIVGAFSKDACEILEDKIKQFNEERPQMEITTDSGENIVTMVRSVSLRDDGAAVIESYDNAGRVYRTSYSPENLDVSNYRSFSEQQFMADINHLVTSDSTAMPSMIDGALQSAYRGQNIVTTLNGEQVVISNVEFKIDGPNSEPPTYAIIVSAETVEGRRPVTVKQGGIDLQQTMRSGTTPFSTDPNYSVSISDISNNPQVREAISALTGKQANESISVEEYCEIVNNIPNIINGTAQDNSGNQLSFTPAVQSALVSLNAAFIGKVANGPQCGYAGNNTDTSDQVTANFIKNYYQSQDSSWEATAISAPQTTQVPTGEPTSFYMSLQGVDVPNNHAYVTWSEAGSDGSPITYTAKVNISAGQPPRLEAVYDGAITPESDSEDLVNLKEQFQAREPALFAAQDQVSGTTNGFQLNIQSVDGQVTSTIKAAAGYQNGRVTDQADEIFFSTFSNPPATELTPPTVDVGPARMTEPRTEAADSMAMSSDEDVTLAGRRVLHYVFMGIKIALSIGSMVANKAAQGSGADTGGNETGGGEGPSTGGGGTLEPDTGSGSGVGTLDPGTGGGGSGPSTGGGGGILG